MFKFMVTNIKFKGLPKNYQKGNIEKLMEMITLTAIFRGIYGLPCFTLDIFHYLPPFLKNFISNGTKIC